MIINQNNELLGSNPRLARNEAYVSLFEVIYYDFVRHKYIFEEKVKNTGISGFLVEQ